MVVSSSEVVCLVVSTTEMVCLLVSTAKIEMVFIVPGTSGMISGSQYF